MQENSILQKKEGSAVQAHIQMLQGIIQKMSDNSKQCKQWCVAIQTIIIGLNKDDVSIGILICSILVTLVLWCQDAGFLAFSRHFRSQQQDFIEHINASNEIYEKEIFSTNKLEGCERYCAFIHALFSPFVFLYYLAFVVLMVVLFLI